MRISTATDRKPSTIAQAKEGKYAISEIALERDFFTEGNVPEVGRKWMGSMVMGSMGGYITYL